MRTRFRRLVASALALATSATVSSAGPVDSSTWETVDRILGRPGKVLPGDVHKYGWPRSDLLVVVGSVQIEPTLALGSWGGFLKTATDGHVMTMGDLVLLSDETWSSVRSKRGGLDVLAIHNHLIGESPQVIYVHFGGHGPAEPLARALRGALDATKIRLAAPATAPTAPSAAETAAFDTLQTVLGRSGSMAGRVLQVGVPRAAKIEEDGMEIPSSLGMATALNFQFVGGHGVQVTALQRRRGPVIRFRDLSYRVHGTGIGLSGNVDVRDAQRVVLGRLGALEGGKDQILVLTAKVVD